MSKDMKPFKTILGIPVKTYDWMPDNEIVIVKPGRVVETVDKYGVLVDRQIVKKPQIVAKLEACDE